MALAAFGGGCCNCKEADQVKPHASRETSISKWEGQVVRRPGSADEDGKVYLVQGGRKHWLLSAAWMTQHGYKWPDDVRVIPAEELAAIPLGDVIP
jgi:hypothetical protein